MLIEKVVEAKKKKIRLHPTLSNRASQLGDPCERKLVFLRTRWQEATLPSVDLQFVFDEGNIQERATIRDLEDAGWQLIEQQRDYHYPEHQITAHLDAKVVLSETEAAPLEIKSMSPFVWVKVNSLQDMLQSKMAHLRKYPAQITLYLLLANAERGFLILKNKSTGQLKEIEVRLDYDYAESLLQKAQRINAHVAAGTIPPPIDWSESICGRCEFNHICLPEAKREALDLNDDPELLEQLTKRQALKAARDEYEQVDEEIKEKVKGKPKILCGDFLVTGRYQDRKDGKQVWTTKIESLKKETP